MKLAKHNIEVQDARPLRQPPYRLPHAFRELVQKEMQRSGVIEPYTSEWDKHSNFIDFHIAHGPDVTPRNNPGDGSGVLKTRPIQWTLN